MQVAAKPPDRRQKAVEQKLMESQVMNNDFYKSLGISLDRKPLQVEGRKLPNPTMLYEATTHSYTYYITENVQVCMPFSKLRDNFREAPQFEWTRIRGRGGRATNSAFGSRPLAIVGAS